MRRWIFLQLLIIEAIEKIIEALVFSLKQLNEAMEMITELLEFSLQALNELFDGINN